MPGYDSLVNFPVPGPGTAYTGTAIADVTPVPQFTIPAGSLTVGSTFRVTAWGRYTSSATATTLVLGVYYGGVAGVALGATAATTITASLTNAQWRLEYEFVVRSIGATGSVEGSGKAFIAASLTSLGTPIAVPGIAPVAVTVDTTTAKNLTVGMTSSVAQSYTVDHCLIENLATLA